MGAEATRNSIEPGWYELMEPFIPMQFHPAAARGGDAPAQPAPPTFRAYQVAVPVSRVLYLEQISGSTPPVPGSIYTYDYFLMHPAEGSIQRVWFVANVAATQIKFVASLVDSEGEEVAAQKVVGVLPVKSTVLFDHVGTTSADGVFLRITSTSQATVKLYVTVELLVSEII